MTHGMRIQFAPRKDGTPGMRSTNPRTVATTGLSRSRCWIGPRVPAAAR